ncbi:MAG: hypothetical protein U0Q16_12820 [Bryobacteraceae bacterium]
MTYCISNKRVSYTLRPRTREANLEFTDRVQKPGQSWYCVRVMQEDEQIAWSSPVWITKPQ